MDPSLDVDYADYLTELKRRLQKICSCFLLPFTVLHVFAHYNDKIFTEVDKQNIESTTNNKGSSEGALLLLDRLCRYPEWYETLLKVLRDPDVKLGHVAQLVENEKHKLDHNIQDEQKRQKDRLKELEEEVKRLQEETNMKEQRILELQQQNRTHRQDGQSQKIQIQQLGQRIDKLEQQNGELRQQGQSQKKQIQNLEEQIAEFKELIPEEGLQQRRREQEQLKLFPWLVLEEERQFLEKLVLGINEPRK